MQERLDDVSGVIFSRVPPVSGEELGVRLCGSLWVGGPFPSTSKGLGLNSVSTTLKQ